MKADFFYLEKIVFLNSLEKHIFIQKTNLKKKICPENSLKKNVFIFYRKHFLFNTENSFYLVQNLVLKTGPDQSVRPVQLGTKRQFGSVKTPKTSENL